MWIALHTFALTFIGLTKLALVIAGLVSGVLAFSMLIILLTAAWLVGAAERGV